MDGTGPHNPAPHVRAISPVMAGMVGAIGDDDRLPARRVMRALGLRSCMCGPLLARGRTLGALTLLSADPAQRPRATTRATRRRIMNVPSESAGHAPAGRAPAGLLRAAGVALADRSGDGKELLAARIVPVAQAAAM